MLIPVYFALAGLCHKYETLRMIQLFEIMGVVVFSIARLIAYICLLALGSYKGTIVAYGIEILGVITLQSLTLVSLALWN